MLGKETRLSGNDEYGKCNIFMGNIAFQSSKLMKRRALRE